MNAYIKADGTLVILAETDTEQYAVSQWMKEALRGVVVWTVATGELMSRLTGRIEKSGPFFVGTPSSPKNQEGE